MKARGTWLIVALALLSGSAEAQTFKREELRIPVPGSGPRGLEAVLVRPNIPGRLPLVVITHGSPRNAAELRTRSPYLFWPQAIEFARRGWVAVIVMRRGHGDSGGEVADSRGTCQNFGILNSATAAAADLRATILHLRARTDIDRARVLTIGTSTGGLAAVALASDPPAGLLASINLAGGQMSDACARTQVENHLVAAFAAFGKRSRIPMLWAYSENDTVFPPQLAQRLREVYSLGGGKVEFVSAPPFGRDGHFLFAGPEIPKWMPYVDQFLKQEKLVWLDALLPPPPPPQISPPTQLSGAGRSSFEAYKGAPPNRAFAVSSNGAYGWSAATRAVEEAKKSALERCAKHAADCRIVVINDEAVP